MNRAELETFVKLPDRAASPVFVGRTKILEDIEEGIKLALIGKSEGTARVVYGAPGAGKTALMHEAKARWDELYKKGDAQAPIAVKIDATDVNSPHRAVVAILHALQPDSDFFSRTTETTTGGGAIGLPGIAKGNIQTALETVSPGTLESAKSDPVSFFAYACRPSSWRRPVCLLIDEAQNVRGYPDRNDENEFLLHLQASNYPILIVFGGLGNTLGALEQAKLSRTAVDALHALPLLTNDESADAAKRFLEIYGIPVITGKQHRRPIVDSIAQASSGWPQHLHGFLAEAGKVALEEDCLSTDDWPEIESRGGARRERYYRQRLHGLETVQKQVAAVVSRIPDEGADPGEVSEHAFNCVSEKDAVKWGGGRFYSALVGKGVLHHDLESGKVICPIPSFRRFLEQL